MAANEAPVTTAMEGGVLRLTLNAPSARNSLSFVMIEALRAALTAAEADKAVRVIVIAAAGPVFSAGHDLKEMAAARAAADGGRAAFLRLFEACSQLMQQVVNHRCPVIAEVSGVATAAGCQLVASCDLAVAGESARFATPGVRIGLFCSTPMVALTRSVAPKHAMEMLLTGDLIDAPRAAEIGLVNRVVADDALVRETMALGRQIAARSQLTVGIGKRAFYAQREMPLAEAYAYAATVMTENMMAADACEGIGAFIGKRDPVWTDT
ncbi:MAG: enoyl-CoA hydratase [Sphingomonadaceae bacterium]|nr:enoyl-CoA hydratase [Sphingomonadaceae bacterium]